MNIHDHETMSLSHFCIFHNYKTISQWKSGSVINIPVTSCGPGKGSQAVRHCILTQKVSFIEIISQVKQDRICEQKQSTIKEKRTKVTVVIQFICMEKLMLQNVFRNISWRNINNVYIIPSSRYILFCWFPAYFISEQSFTGHLPWKSKMDTSYLKI